MRDIIGGILGRIVVWGLLISFCVYIVRTWLRWSRAEVKLSPPRWRSGITMIGSENGLLNANRRTGCTLAHHWRVPVLLPSLDARLSCWVLDRTVRSGNCADRDWSA